MKKYYTLKDKAFYAKAVQPLCDVLYSCATGGVWPIEFSLFIV